MKIYKAVAVLSTLSCAAVFGACKKEDNGEKEKTSYTITFRQDGYDDVTRTVLEGEDLEDVPVLQPKKGYIMAWDSENFDNIRENKLITARATPKTYTIYYNVDLDGATIAATSQAVTYNEKYSLLIPESDEYIFDGWVISGETDVFVDGTYLYDENVSLTATWHKQWSGQH